MFFRYLRTRSSRRRTVNLLRRSLDVSCLAGALETGEYPMQFEGHMAIISRGAGVALLLVGLTLLSGNARAAEPSYDD